MNEKKHNFKEALTAEKTREIFQDIDDQLSRNIEVTVLGGIAVILLNFRSRATRDIDVFPIGDAELFKKVAKSLGYPVHLVSLALPVDLEEAETPIVFRGKYLKVFALSGLDLIKTKIDRYGRQDREDIRAILKVLNPTKKKFFQAAKEMKQNIVAPEARIQTTLEIIIEEYYGSDALEEFENFLK